MGVVTFLRRRKKKKSAKNISEKNLNSVMDWNKILQINHKDYKCSKKWKSVASLGSFWGLFGLFLAMLDFAPSIRVAV